MRLLKNFCNINVYSDNRSCWKLYSLCACVAHFALCLSHKFIAYENHLDFIFGLEKWSIFFLFALAYLSSYCAFSLCGNLIFGFANVLSVFDFRTRTIIKYSQKFGTKPKLAKPNQKQILINAYELKIANQETKMECQRFIFRYC